MQLHNAHGPPGSQYHPAAGLVNAGLRMLQEPSVAGWTEVRYHITPAPGRITGDRPSGHHDYRV